MATLILNIIGSVLKITALVFGDHLLAKWLGEFKFWLYSAKDPILVEEMERTFTELQDSFLNQKKNDGPLP